MAASRRIRSVAALLERWPSISDFARDIGVKPTHANVMKLRGSIPADYWPAVVDAADKRGIKGVSLETLTEIRRAKFGPPQKQGRAA